MFTLEHIYKSSETVSRENENLFVPLPNQRFVHHSPCPQLWVFPAACSALPQRVLSLKVLLRNWNSQTLWTPASATPHGMMRISEMHFPRLNYTRLKQENTFNSASWHLSAAQLSLQQYELSLHQRLRKYFTNTWEPHYPAKTMRHLPCTAEHKIKCVLPVWQQGPGHGNNLISCSTSKVPEQGTQSSKGRQWLPEGAAPARGEVPPSVLAPSRIIIQGGKSE